MQSRMVFAFPPLGRQVWMAATGVVVIVYLVNFFTPFRLTNDTVRYFALLEDEQGTWPAAFGQPKDFLPLGYVFFLRVLSWLRLLNPFGIALFQLLYLAGSLHFIKKLFGASLNTWLFVSLTLLNWTAIKFVMTPLSEVQFLFFSCATIYCYQRFTETGAWRPLVLALVLCVIAFLTRTAGIVLFATLTLSFLISNRGALTNWLRQHVAVSLAGGIGLLSGLAFLVTRSKFITYMGYFWRPLVQDRSLFFTRNLRLHLMDWAELFINSPVSKVQGLFSPKLAGAIYLLAGLSFLGALLWLLAKHRSRIPLVVTVYLVLYLALIFNWPFYEARFFFPIMPLVLAVYLLHFVTASRLQQRVGVAFLCYYLLAGIFVLVYYTRLSLDKEFMMKRHDAGKWQTEYGYLFSGRPVSDSTQVDLKALYILRKYN